MSSIVDTEVLRAMESGTGEWTNVQSPVRRMLVTMATALQHIGNVAGSDSHSLGTADNASGKPASVWREIAALRADLPSATRTEVHESLPMKADGPRCKRLRMEGESARVNMLRNMLTTTGCALERA